MEQLETLRWWRAEKDNDSKAKDPCRSALAGALVQHVTAVEKQQSSRFDGYKTNLRLYQGRQGLPGKATDSFILTPTGQVLSLNVIASITRSLRAKIVKNRPAPWVLTDCGTAMQRRSAEQCQQFLVGAIYECGVYPEMARAFDLMAICGSADVKVYPDFDAGMIRVECGYPWEYPIDDQDSYYGRPRSRYQVAYLDRQVVHEIFADASDDVHAEIDKAERSRGDEGFGFTGSTDQIKIYEGWHLKSGKSADDGLHCIALPGAVLWAREYGRDRFPLARILCEPEPVGYHGTSIADELRGIQAEIDNTLTKIREGHEMGGHALVLVESGSKVNKAKLTNLSHSIVEYTGQPPVVQVIPAVAPEVYEWVWSLVERAYQIWGASQLSASAQIPAGLSNASGKALRVYQNAETERFSYIARAWEQLLLDICDRIIDAAEDLSEADGNFAVRYRGNEGIRSIKWSEIKLARDSYVLQIQPKSYLSDSGPGRVQDVMDRIDRGTMDPRAMPMLLRDPDTRSMPDTYESNLNLARRQVEGIIYDGKEAYCESYQDADLCMQVALEMYTRAQTYTDVEAGRLDMLRQYIDGVQQLLAPPPAPPQPPPGPDMGMPPDGAPPMPPEMAPAAPAPMGGAV